MLFKISSVMKKIFMVFLWSEYSASEKMLQLRIKDLKLGTNFTKIERGYNDFDSMLLTNSSKGDHSVTSDIDLNFEHSGNAAQKPVVSTVFRDSFFPMFKNTVINSETDRPYSRSLKYLKNVNKTGFGESRRFVSGEGVRKTYCGIPVSITNAKLGNTTGRSENGKNVVITKILRSRKCKKNLAGNSVMQRRQFSSPSHLTDTLHIPWMTKRIISEDHEDVDEKISSHHPNEEQFINNIRPVPLLFHNGNKMRVLNLFTIVKFDNGECYFGGLQGICLHQLECKARSGKTIGSCAQGYGTCCYVENTCGEITRENSTYFVNDGFPKPMTYAPKICTLTVEKAHSEVQQLRIEFIVLELRSPNNGTCISDRFTITGHNMNDIIPDICGINSQQHIYVDIDESKGPYNLNVITMGNEFPRTFQILVKQIGKDDKLLAPKNCLQYHTEISGVVESFNYQSNNLGNLPEAIPGYFNNLNYVICLKKNHGFCSVTYENDDDIEIHDSPSFQLLNTDTDGRQLLPPNQGGAEVFDCPDDYIVINGIRLCGERLNDAAFDADYTKNYPVTEFSNGPFMLQVRTNNIISGRGFYLKYRQNPCLQ